MNYLLIISTVIIYILFNSSATMGILDEYVNPILVESSVTIYQNTSPKQLKRLLEQIRCEEISHFLPHPVDGNCISVQQPHLNAYHVTVQGTFSFR